MAVAVIRVHVPSLSTSGYLWLASFDIGLWCYGYGFLPHRFCVIHFRRIWKSILNFISFHFFRLPLRFILDLCVCVCVAFSEMSQSFI